MDRSIDDTSFADSFGNEPEESGSAFEQLDIQHYLRILRKYKFPITLFTAAVTALGAYYAYTATPIYSATSTLLIESQENSPITFEQLVGNEAESGEYYQTQYELLRSRGLALRVVEKLNLWEHPEFSAAQVSKSDQQNLGNPQSPEGLSSAISSLKNLIGVGENTSANNEGAVVVDLNSQTESSSVDVGASRTLIQPEQPVEIDPDFAKKADGAAFSLELDKVAFGDTTLLNAEQRAVVSTFLSRLSVAPIRKTKLVKISFDSPDPDMAALVANTVADEYINSYLDAKVELTTRASQWLSTRLSELKLILDESEDRLIAFKKDNGLVDVGGSVERLNEQELLLVTAELAQARSDLSAKQNLFREVQALQGDADLLGSLPAFQADPLIQRVKIDQGQAQRNLDELRNRYGTRHPRVIDARSQLATLDATLKGHVSRVVGSVTNDFQLSRQRVSSIEAKLNAGKSDIQVIGTKKFELDTLEREVTTNRTIYDTFFSRITEAKSADGLEAANARISDYALPPGGPYKPKKQLIIALAALGSLILSMLMAFLYEQMDETIKGTHDIENRLGLKLLGILPLIKGGTVFNRSSKLPVNPLDIPDKNRTFSEAVNTARTAICLSDGNKPRKVITITSSAPGEGKSTASINLAFSLAQMERVLLIDCDMRRPTVAKSAGYERDVPGLSSLITQSASARQCIIRGAFDGNFDILPSGPIPEQPLELLSSKRFEKILAQLSKHYDRIVIDSAPAQAVSDALVLGKLSDAVVYIVKSHDTTMDVVKRGTKRLKEVNAPLVGVLITQVDIDKISAYGGDYYFQGYYDYYGYRDKDAGKSSKNNGRGNKIRLSQQELLDIRNDNSDVDLELNLDYSDYSHDDRIQRPASYHDDSQFDRTSKVSVGRDMRRREVAERSLSEDKRAYRGSRDDLDIL